MVIMMVSKTIDAGSIPAEPVLTLYDANEKKRTRHNLFLLPF